MNNNIDDWLNSIGFNEELASVDNNVSNPENLPDATTAIASTVSVPEEEPSLRTLTDNDFDDILSDIGFSETPEAEAEEIIEDEEEHIQGMPCSEDEVQQMVVDGRSVVEAIHNSDLLQQASERLVESIDVSDTQDWTGSETPETDETGTAEPLIQPNSPTLLIDDSTSRFSGTEWYDAISHKSIIIAGMGGIGSWLALNIARVRPNAIFLYDDDHVEDANMSGQFFNRSQVGKYKVEAVNESIHSFCSLYRTYAYRYKFTSDSGPDDIMMCGFDNMEARRTFFNSWLNHVSTKTNEDKRKCLFLDGRLSIDTLQIFCITGDDEYNINRYLKDYLFTDAEADETVCSMKQTTYLACMIGSLMTNLFVNFVANSLDPVIPYDLPFFTEYDAQNMIFKTEN